MTTTHDAPAVPSLEDLARDICSLAQRGGMPDTLWMSDRRIGRASAILGITREVARATDWSTWPSSPDEPIVYAVVPDPSTDDLDVPVDPVDPLDDYVSDADFDEAPSPSPVPTSGPTEVWSRNWCRRKDSS